VLPDRKKNNVMATRLYRAGWGLNATEASRLQAGAFVIEDIGQAISSSCAESAKKILKKKGF
jgi:hypothetical protein